MMADDGWAGSSSTYDAIDLSEKDRRAESDRAKETNGRRKKSFDVDALTILSSVDPFDWTAERLATIERASRILRDQQVIIVLEISSCNSFEDNDDIIQAHSPTTRNIGTPVWRGRPWE